GVATGTMIVGDAGPPDASDYTVLGATVNLAARLESANKAVGTRTLITARTLELVGENRYAVRPIGRLQVVGKQEGVAVYEPLGPADAVDADTQQIIDETRAMVDAFQDGRFEDCLTAARTLEHHAPSAKLIALYRKACEAQRDNPATFTGQIVLTEK
ncbi:MAG: adenylate/guanylate cyclase domain-containing protein, partial [Phycisphaeraceae bacterium]